MDNVPALLLPGLFNPATQPCAHEVPVVEDFADRGRFASVRDTDKAPRFDLSAGRSAVSQSVKLRRCQSR